MTKVHKIGFDGLHRCGKGTQISLIGTVLSEKDFPYAIVRGDGTRKGLGLSKEDPFSEWWKSHYNLFFKKDRNPKEKRYLSDLVYSKLTEESYEKLKEMSLLSTDISYLLIDRSFVSRWFVKRQQEPGITLRDSLEITNPLTGKPLKPFLPDALYVLNVSRDELLCRVESSTDSPEKKEFRKKNILEYYDLFIRVLADLPKDYLGKKIKIIDGERDPLTITNEILREEKIGI